MKLRCLIETISHIIEGYFAWFIDKLKGKTKQMVKERYAICSECEHNSHGICMLCGCVLKAKVRVDFMLDEEGKSIDGCPERKW